MIRYGELSTKGKNINFFINQLGRNVQNVLDDFKSVKVSWKRDRMYVILNGEEADPILERLENVFGISNMSKVIKVDKNLAASQQAVQEIMKEKYTKGISFKINTQRADHSFEYDTFELNRKLGAAVVEAYPDVKVQMKNPDLTIKVEVRVDGIYMSVDTIAGAGGMPVGTAGKGMLMLSGGIDSPVAGYLTMKRGVEIEAVHFHSPPYTSPQALKKAKDLTAKIARYSGEVVFIEVPFTEIQEAIKNHVPEGYIMTITRRFMMRLTEKIRQERSALAIMNGESLGQVASQTLESMQAINAVTTTPILRPLISMDKSEIVDIAHHIDTFELSTLPYEDCCTIFTPPRPKTKPSAENAEKYEQALDVKGLMERAFDQIKIETITPSSQQSLTDQKKFEDIL